MASSSDVGDGLNLLEEKISSSISSLEEMFKQMTCTLDSGACVSVIPKELCEGFPVEKDERSKVYHTASGEEVVDEGAVKLRVLTEDWAEANMKFRVTEPSVRKPLTSAYQMCAAGNRIVLDLDTGSYIFNKRTRQFTALHARNGTFEYDVWVKCIQNLVAASRLPGGAPSGFGGQVPP